ncbi:MAG: DUF3108 domain-containing protein [Akkermansiaceae bacterium]
MSLLKSLNTSLALLIFSTAANSAENWQVQVSKEKPGPHPELSQVHLTYQATFNNLIKAGEVGFIFGKKDKNYPQYYVSQSYGGSYYKQLAYSFDLSSFSHPKTLEPKILIVNEKDDKETVKITNKYNKTSVLNKKTAHILKEDRIEKDSYTFEGVKIHDPLTAMLFLRSQKLDQGEKTHLCIHPFNSPYYGVATVLGKEMHKGRQCIKLDLALRKIDKRTGKLGEYKKLRKATIWLSDDAYRIPIEFRVEIKLANHLNIGSARLNLIKLDTKVN